MEARRLEAGGLQGKGNRPIIIFTRSYVLNKLKNGIVDSMFSRVKEAVVKKIKGSDQVSPKPIKKDEQLSGEQEVKEIAQVQLKGLLNQAEILLMDYFNLDESIMHKFVRVSFPRSSTLGCFGYDKEGKGVVMLSETKYLECVKQLQDLLILKSDPKTINTIDITEAETLLAHFVVDIIVSLAHEYRHAWQWQYDTEVYNQGVKNAHSLDSASKHYAKQHPESQKAFKNYFGSTSEVDARQGSAEFLLTLQDILSLKPDADRSEIESAFITGFSNLLFQAQSTYLINS